jgi:hypothetical protein
MVACTHEEFPQPPNGEHPVVAIVAIVAMIAAMLLITWARFEVHGTRDIEAALTEDGPIEAKPEEERELDAAVTSNRFATGVSAQ